MLGGLVALLVTILHSQNLLSLTHLFWIVSIVGVPLVLYNIALWSLKDEAGENFVRWVGRGGGYKPYRAWLTKWLDWIDQKLCPPEYLDGKNSAFQQPPSAARAWNWRAYDRNLLWAVAYPAALITITWIVSGKSILMSDIQLFSTTEKPFVRMALAASLFLLLLLWPLQRVFARALFTSFSERLIRLPLLPWFVVSGIIAGIIVMAFLLAAQSEVKGIGSIVFGFALLFGLLSVSQIASSGVFIATLSVGLALLSVVTGPTAFVFMLFMQASVASAAHKALENNIGHKHSLKPAIVLTALTTALLVQIYWTSYVLSEASEVYATSERSATIAFLLFLGLFPLVNTVFDFISVGLTRYCLRQSIQEKPIFGLPKSWRWLVFNLIDLCGAVITFASLIAALLFSIHLLNSVSAAPLMPLESLMQNLTAINEDAAPMGWFYFMLLSTLLPTALHLILAIMGAITIHPLRITRKLLARPLLKGGPVTEKHREFMALLLALWSSAVILAVYTAYRALTPDLLADAKSCVLAQMNWLINTFELR